MGISASDVDQESIDGLAEAVRVFMERWFGLQCKNVTITAMDNQIFHMPIHPQRGDASPPCAYFAGFRSVLWLGVPYNFSPKQAAVVKELWMAWESESPGCYQDHLMKAAGSPGGRLLDLFRSRGETHPAWGTMIVTEGAGFYSLGRMSVVA